MPPHALNKNNSAVKRIMQEARELANDPCTDYSAAPLEDDIFEWHCTIRGSSGTEFEGGLYHFRILLPAEYPFRPPSIMMLTPNGRFELNTKICISFTSYHEELWQPAWGVRTAIIGLQGFFPLKGQAAVGVGSLESHTSERKRLAALSREWTCPHCQVPNIELLPDPSPPPSARLPPTATPQLAPLTGAEPSTPTASPQEHGHGDSVAQQPPPVLNAAHTSPGAPSGRGDATPEAPAIEARSAPPDIAVVEFPHTGRAQKPPVLLDTAIMILLVLLCAVVFRRVV